MKFQLLVKRKGTSEGHIVDFATNTCLIGRTSGDLRLDDSRCSRQHALIFETASGDLAIKHVGNTNRTYLNDKPVASIQKLSANDKIRIAGVNIFVVKISSERNTKRAEDIECDTKVQTAPNSFNGRPNLKLKLFPKLGSGFNPS